MFNFTEVKVDEELNASRLPVINVTGKTQRFLKNNCDREETLCVCVSVCVCMCLRAEERRAFVWLCIELRYPFGYVSRSRNKDN